MVTPKIKDKLFSRNIHFCMITNHSQYHIHQSKKVTIKFEDKAFSKKIHFCSIFVTSSGTNVPCLDVNRNFELPRCI